MSKARTLADLVATGGELADGAISVSEISDLTATSAELNILDGVVATTSEINTLNGLTATTSELNKLDGVTATTSEINALAGLTSTTAELNTLDGFTGDVTDLNRLDVTTEGQSENSKVVTQSSSGIVEINGILFADQVQTGGSFNGDWDTDASSSGTLTLNLAVSNVKYVTLTENITTLSLTSMGLNRSAAYLLLITQDSGGSGYTIDWSTSSGTTIYWKDGTAPTLSSTANVTDGVLLLINNSSGTNIIYGWHVGTGFSSV